VIGRILRDDGRFAVAAEVETAEDALAKLQTEAFDLILLDIELPGQSGLDALPAILKLGQGGHVFVLSALGESGGKAAIQALALGASGVMSKPGRTRFSGDFSAELCGNLAELLFPAALKSQRAKAKTKPVKPLTQSVRKTATPTSIIAAPAIAIGGSTGGIPAIQRFLIAFPQPMLCPIFIAQHLPDAFLPYLASELQRISSRKVQVLAHAMPIDPHGIYLVSGRMHFALAQHGNAISAIVYDNYSGNDLMGQELADRSVDRMFDQLTRHFGTNLHAVILSGMGRDGATGAHQVQTAGGTLWVQDVESAAIWGMPGAVVDAGLSPKILPPDAIAQQIAASLA
jgi:two-component system, chemotaxis family, protein-glutamate methylesterase/glutaminase